MILEAVKASMTKHFTLAQPLYPEGHRGGTLCHTTVLSQPFTLLSGHFILPVMLFLNLDSTMQPFEWKSLKR